MRPTIIIPLPTPAQAAAAEAALRFCIKISNRHGKLNDDELAYHQKLESGLVWVLEVIEIAKEVDQ